MIGSALVVALALTAQTGLGAESPNSFFAESPWEFGAPGTPSADRALADPALADALTPDATAGHSHDGQAHVGHDHGSDGISGTSTFAARRNSGKNNTCNVCCVGCQTVDAVCLGGFITRSIRNTVYCGTMGGTLGCLGGLALGLIPAIIASSALTAFMIPAGGVIGAILLGCGGVGCLGGAGAGAPLGFYWAALFPNWDITRPAGAPPPPRGGRGGRFVDDDEYYEDEYYDEDYDDDDRPNVRYRDDRSPSKTDRDRQRRDRERSDRAKRNDRDRSRDRDRARDRDRSRDRDRANDRDRSRSRDRASDRSRERKDRAPAARSDRSRSDRDRTSSPRSAPARNKVPARSTRPGTKAPQKGKANQPNAKSRKRRAKPDDDDRD